MARALIVGCGCRGRSLGERLLAAGWAVRGTSRRDDGLAAIEAAGIEAALADPDRPGTLLDLVGDVAVVHYLLGSAAGAPEALAAIHGPRLERLMEKLVDTPVRGVVYEAAGSAEPALLETGAEIVRSAARTWRIPVEIVTAEPNDLPHWSQQMVDAALAVLSRRGGANSLNSDGNSGRSAPDVKTWRLRMSYAKDVLVETDWVAEHLDDDSIRIVEVDENPALYAEGHIPGAIGFDWKDDLQDQVKRDFLGPEDFAALMGSRGISNDHTVVLYGDRNNWFAAYTYWYFRYYGHDKVKLVNGPREKWIAEGRETSTEAPSYPAATFSAEAGDDTIRAYREEVREALGGSTNLVDVRSPQEYSGELIAMAGYEQEGAQRAGHIPGAASVPWAQAVNEDGTFKSADELRDLYTSKGVLGDGAPVVAYCRIGERSAHTWFVLHELLGEESVKNYDGSWTEWGNLVGVPIEKDV